MIPEKITTHEVDGVKRLLTQYRGTTVVEGFLRVWLRRHQELENVAYDFFSILDIDNATGKNLDICGGIVGEVRRHADDDTYRVMIKTRIKILSNFTTIQLAIEVFRVLMGTEDTTYTPLYPAGMALHANNPAKLLSDAEIKVIMYQVIPAGVSLEITESTDPAFAFEGDTEGEGFDDVFDPGGGGKLAGEMI